MPENVSFAEIPVDIRTPGQYIEIDNSKAVQGLPQQERKILILGQRLTAGTVAQQIPTRMLNADQAAGYFGRGSQLHGMIAAAKIANPYSDMWAVALDDLLAGVVATGTITVTGSPTEAGTIKLYIGGVRLQAGVAAGDTVTVVAASIAAAINAAADLPVTATPSVGVVTITARHKGECGNAIDIRLNYYMGEATPKGVSLAIVAMASGSGNPNVSNALSAIGNDQYYTIVTPWTDSANMVALENELGTRWGPMSQKTGHAFAGLSGTHGTLTTYGAARNSLHSTIVGSGKSPTAPWIWAAVLASVCEFNGAIDPARPFQTLLLSGLLPPSEKERFTREERNLLLKDGISTFLVDAGGRVLIERVVTTYQTNAFGIEDISYLDLETKWTVDYIRYAVRARIALRFPRYKLADDGTNFAPGQAIVTPRVIRAELLGLFRELEQVGLVEDFDQFKADLLVVRSDSDPNRVNAVIPPDIVNQFRVFAAAVQFRL
ncbi:phage tail sheath subtilisin-like domain-containing protein [Nitrosospira sp. NpAV]|uniref:phage tail sheath subtilisin-like domain-containing protein n=1 Tax=Nitrosospira sp. NpAV TaxID=58133 RepID=UPI0005A1618A|nr:phage tail sheath subtilisin-like domain-containing protein [Nitrosospira sp. NpAV]KIO49597.1 tail protein [Nitrosospira sp. NpAV]